MRNVKVWIIAAAISISLVLSACSETTQSPISNSQGASQNTFSIDEIAPYSGQAHITINDNKCQ